jgi:hypothetical protein
MNILDALTLDVVHPVHETSKTKKRKQVNDAAVNLSIEAESQNGPRAAENDNSEYANGIY